MPIKGRQLESAIGLACKLYQRAGRADIHHNATPMGRRPDGSHYYRQKADADFEGPLAGNGSYKAEAKEVHTDNFSIFDEDKGLKPHQRAALERAARLGAVSGVIVGYLGRSPWEIYFVPIAEPEFQNFLSTEWRKSLTPDMCRAWGQLLPLGVSLAGKPLVKFLDGGAHPDKDAAIARVNAERLSKPLELFGDDGVVHPLEEDLPKRTPVLDRLLKDDPLSPTALRRFARKKGTKTGWWGK